MVAVHGKPRDTGAVFQQVNVVDCDIHLRAKDDFEILEYMEEPFRSRKNAHRALHGMGSYPIPVSGYRGDAIPEGLDRAASEPDFVFQQLFVEAGVDIAINIPQGPGLMPTPDPAWNSVISAAINTWQVETWLTAYNAHGRFRGSIAVAPDNPARAAVEIEKWAGHPSLVQVYVPHFGGLPYGHPAMDPIWEAANRHRLPVVVHVNRGGTDPMLTPMGHFNHFAEAHSIGYSLTYAAQLATLICGGVFERFPNLVFVFAEGGVSWVGPLVWHLDKNWRLLRSEIPELKRKPSEYLAGHVRFTSQPIEEPDDARDLVRSFELIDAARLVMFSTDYPHWDFDKPQVIPSRLGNEARVRILCENARELYGLPSEITV